MKRWITTILATLLIAAGGNAWAASEQVQKLEDATSVVRAFVEIPENAIPPRLLREAHGIAVIPSVFKAGFILGGRHGNGVLSVRTDDGSWSNPVFISVTGASIGWQIGASSSDIILVFKTQRSVDQIADGQITLGADASIAAGPVGRSASAATNASFDAEVYSYSRSRGLFAGVSLEGGALSINEEGNWRFYDQMDLDALSILRNSDESAMPEAGQRFVYTLDRYMPPAEGSASGRADDRTPRATPSRSQDSYGQGYSTPYPSNDTEGDGADY